MTKLCPRGKAAAKRKFKVYPSAYANAYASKICAGKIKDPSGVKRKDFRGPKPSKAMGGRIYKADGGDVKKRPTAFRKDRKFFKKTSKTEQPTMAHNMFTPEDILVRGFSYASGLKELTINDYNKATVKKLDRKSTRLNSSHT